MSENLSVYKSGAEDPITYYFHENRIQAISDDLATLYVSIPGR